MRHQDVAKLFAWLRERSFGISSIRDIGDFYGHSEEKDKGMVTEDIRNFLQTLRFWCQFQLTQRPTDLQNAPPDFPKLAMIGLRRVSDDVIRRETGKKRKVAEQILKDTIAQFEQNPDGRLRLSGGLFQIKSAFWFAQYLTSQQNQSLMTKLYTATF
ncbi:hypothetical protein Sa4125_09770 [Aureimonas sp. SA4125]|uniref:hypothetical protein n=1 Tax=Aureimonas sp. SA4125 TaxID=2826993 RepID=UPI001CC3ABBD|nr:hypothetical protein [Aureimonas sp. SA4125]BDA83435.1 hypothetical protein Sa4125_09770 [Aureimonas sp. SA4125]